MSSPFARILSPDERRAEREREVQRFSDLRASLSRLVKNEDFRAWFSFIDGELCGDDFGKYELTPFTQGKRATASFLRESIAIAEGGPAFLSDLTRKHFNTLSEAIVSSRVKTENGEN